MGLDFLEIMMIVEEKFQICFEEDDFSEVRTVGDFYEIIVKKVDFVDVEYCASQRIFYKFRKYCTEELKLKRSEIVLEADLTNIFTSFKGKEDWLKFSRYMGMKVPDLRGSDHLYRVVNLFLLFYGCAGSFYLNLHIGVIVISLFLLWVILPQLVPLNEVPNISVKELLTIMVGKNSEVLIQSKDISNDDIWKILRHVIHDQMGIDLKYITYEATIGDDLGID